MSQNQKNTPRQNDNSATAAKLDQLLEATERLIAAVNTNSDIAMAGYLGTSRGATGTADSWLPRYAEQARRLREQITESATEQAAAAV